MDDGSSVSERPGPGSRLGTVGLVLGGIFGVVAIVVALGALALGASLFANPGGSEYPGGPELRLFGLAAIGVAGVLGAGGFAGLFAVAVGIMARRARAQRDMS